MLRATSDRLVSRPVAFALAALCVVGLAAAGLARLGSEQPAARALPVAPPATAAGPTTDLNQDKGQIGVIFAREEVIVAARSAGHLLALHVRVGDRVQKGQVLATLDSVLLEQELASNRAALAAAFADAEKADVEVAQASDKLGRSEKLAGVNPQIEIAEARFQRQTALAHVTLSRATIAGARARVEQAAENLRSAELRAELDGAVAERYLDAGAQVVAGTPLLRLITSGDLWVRFAVPENLAGTVSHGQAFAIDVPATGAHRRGHVETIAPEIDPSSQMLLVEGRLDGGDGDVATPGLLASGLEARVHLEVASSAGPRP